ncbi:hypothetical protein [Pseudomonas sp. 44 R 15]|nr:hypothetical protein [Pseudomonas sp. 44 R 15]
MLCGGWSSWSVCTDNLSFHKRTNERLHSVS